MKKNLSKHLFLLLLLTAVAGSFTACNKGYGCPTNFKVSSN